MPCYIEGQEERGEKCVNGMKCVGSVLGVALWGSWMLGARKMRSREEKERWC